MDYSKGSGIDRRVVINTAEHDGKQARIVNGSRLFPDRQEELWDAVTNPERIKLWFLPVSGDLKIGGKYQLKGHANGTIIYCDPEKKFLKISWECDGDVNWVTVRLEPGPDDGKTATEKIQTRLTLEHILAKDFDEKSEERWKKYGPGATGVGWDLVFLGLGLHLDNEGASVNGEESNAWMMSQEGKQFIRDCAIAWGDAHCQSGEEEGIAMAMAERTAKFYCGEE